MTSIYHLNTPVYNNTVFHYKLGNCCGELMSIRSTVAASCMDGVSLLRWAECCDDCAALVGGALMFALPGRYDTGAAAGGIIDAWGDLY